MHIILRAKFKLRSMNIFSYGISYNKSSVFSLKSLNGKPSMCLEYAERNRNWQLISLFVTLEFDRVIQNIKSNTFNEGKLTNELYIYIYIDVRS